VITTIARDYEDIDEFMASSDKVNPRFVKETKAYQQDCTSDNILSTGNQDFGLTPEKQPATSTEGDTADAEKLEKLGKTTTKDLKRRKGLAGMT